MTRTHTKARSIVLTAALAVGLTAGATATATASPATPACSATSAHVPGHAAGPADCDPVGIPVDLGEPTDGATDTWQITETNDVGYAIPADWTGRAIVGDGGAGHEWESPEIAVSDEYGDLHWRILVQSPFYDQEMPDPKELNKLGYHASYIEVEGASEAVLTAAQTEHWADGAVETIDFQVYVQSASTGVVTRFMGELPAGAEGQFLLDNFVPTIQP
ncbi:hypothetical protein APR04_000641 [Promicromonospora umidemergens]|uniref:Alternate signal-mediated exported protein n=1 Tax=Promicromonospora umidemergens TaxID=629679 RepID=A0ABP8XEE3_9MICO|nr:hypothetical protein [Promicromonospora umidemergens]MCP2281752.1 hypothetical protein [Promicromonospora umidemergens]